MELHVAETPDAGTLNAILMAVERSGYQVLEGEVDEWATPNQSALVGCEWRRDSRAHEEPDLMLAFGVAGAFVGRYAGTQIRKHEVICQIRSAYRGGRVELVPVNDEKAPTITLADWVASARA